MHFRRRAALNLERTILLSYFKNDYGVSKKTNLISNFSRTGCAGARHCETHIRIKRKNSFLNVRHTARKINAFGNSLHILSVSCRIIFRFPFDLWVQIKNQWQQYFGFVPSTCFLIRSFSVQPHLPKMFILADLPENLLEKVIQKVRNSFW